MINVHDSIFQKLLSQKLVNDKKTNGSKICLVTFKVRYDHRNLQRSLDIFNMFHQFLNDTKSMLSSIHVVLVNKCTNATDKADANQRQAHC